MKKEIWIVLVLFLVLNLTIVLNLNLVLAEELNISYPLNVNVGEVFWVNLSLINFTEDSYDIKIDMLNDSKHIIKRYWDGEWKSGNYYIGDAINLSIDNSRIFEINVTEDYEGNNSLIIKLRNSNNIIVSFESPINISLVNSSSGPGNSSEGEGNNESEEEVIYYNISWRGKDIVNGDRFYVIFNIFNLENKSYDIRLWIENDDGRIISDRYDKKNKEWKSGTYYINELANGSLNIRVNFSERIKLRIREDYKNFNGSAKIYFKIRGMDEIEEDIEILEKIIISEGIGKDESILEDNQTKITTNAIKLEDRDREAENIKSNNIILYESNAEIVRKYSLHIFAFLSLLFSVLVLWRKI